MPQPVPPPETPAVIQSVTVENSASLDKSSNGTPVSTPTRTLQSGVLSRSIPSEVLVPQPSVLTASKSAALLGPPISIGYSQRSKFSDQASPRIPNFVPSKSSFVALGKQNITHLVTQERGGQVREFELNVPTQETQPSPEETVAPPSNQGEAAPQPSGQQETVAPPSNQGEAVHQHVDIPELKPASTGISGVLELTADRQEYNEQEKVVTAEGNVALRFRSGLLNADRVQINLPNRLVVATGNVALTRGNQVLRGERFEYYLVQDTGVVLNARGEFYTPTSGTDLSITPPIDGSPDTLPPRPLSDRITSNQPLQGISNAGGYSFVLGAGSTATNVAAPTSGGSINRVRYQADRVDFDGQNGIATNVRITNDPFSPPELELRADTARFRRIEPLVDEIVATKPRLVFDQGLKIPTFRRRIRIDRRPREPSLFTFGYDGEDRGGLFVQSNLEVLNTRPLRFTLTPQYFIQKAVTEGSYVDPSVFGLRAQLEGDFGPQTTLEGRAVFTSLDLGEVEDELRASLRLRQTIGTPVGPHSLTLEYSYRDRLFNGSLGFQTVQSSLGAVLTSPIIPLGQTGIDLSYQVGVQIIDSETDRIDLLDPLVPPFDSSDFRISLTRYQGSATLSRTFPIWRGQALPATPTEGLRYTPTPVVPYLNLDTYITGVANAYSNGDSQESLSATVGLVGQVGHFSRPFLDYTGFNISYTQVALNGQSPFLFDREADTTVLSGGITQQIYGPFRLGFQTSLNLDTGEEISTDYFIEYSRRTYNIVLRYNPVLQLGSISFRINDFNWTGNPGVLDTGDVRPVIQGVTR
ncbi:MAG TPA: DUF3769 domain-containing protein [Oculatellaceae cyanobacterium]